MSRESMYLSILNYRFLPTKCSLYNQEFLPLIQTLIDSLLYATVFAEHKDEA